MSPEVNHTGSLGRYDEADDRGNNLDKDSSNRVYNELADRIDDFLNADAEKDAIRKGTQEKVRESLHVIGKALKDYGYALPINEAHPRFDSLALSFNGGKDCLVLLLLYIYILDRQGGYSRRRIPTCFVTPPQTFEEIDEFVTECAERYTLDVDRISLPMKLAFTKYLERNKQIKAVLVGTRRTDPHGEFLTHFDHTDHGWPEFMRVHPVINWHYWEIWDVCAFYELSDISFYEHCKSRIV